jgi:hypothetical protein
MTTWNETLHYGWPELKAMALAHAIILGISVIRYWIRPWWAARRSRLERQERAPGEAGGKGTQQEGTCQPRSRV